MWISGTNGGIYREIPEAAVYKFRMDEENDW